MDINELESFKLSDAVKFHDNLNPALWTEKGELDPEVKAKLMEIARDFIAELGISTLKVEDITISGSNAAYTYTPHSDLDLHIIVDFKKLNNDEVYQELFNAKKTLYNDTHDIKVHGVPVELYVQDSNQPVVSLGEYSLLKNEWLKIPKKRKANFDQNATRLKYEKLGSLIELALKQKDVKKIDQVLKTIKRYRKAGLDSTGEFGPENLAFKALRKQGYIQKLYDLKNHLHSRELSIEDYHPNAKPRGPEFPPTMPAGTVRVDVSDVYDWYKLGQHISDLEGLGKHDFGKGPPSTILSFGDEDTEHKYIDNLLKTGLTTTDIDPKGHEPMKGQKTDPRYNVKEETGKKSAIYSTDVYGMTAYHSKCLEPGCDWESKRYDSIKLAQNAAQKHAQKHFKKGVAEGSGSTFVYHVTPTKNLKFIAKQGLVPTIGDRTSKIAGEKSGIYAFPNKTSAEDAVMNWLGDEFEDEPLTMLKIDVSGLENHISKGADYELIVGTTIEPSRIKKVNIQLEEASGYIPSEKEKNDPRFKTALTKDVRPDSIKKNAKAFGFNVTRAGIPPLFRK